MNSAGTVTGACRHGAVSSQFRSRLRYQFSGPVNPAPAYSETKTARSSPLSQSRGDGGSGHTSSSPPPGGTTGSNPGAWPEAA
jgi:hypothetical protein